MINRRLVTDTLIRKARWRLVPLIAGAVANILIGAIFAVVAGSFWSAHLHLPPVLVFGIALHVLGIVFIVIGVGRLALVRQIDLALPVLEIQRSLASLQRWESWSFHAAWVGVNLVAAAIPVAFVIAMKGAGSWQPPTGYLLANGFVWLAIAVAPPLMYVVSRRRKGKLAARMDAFLSNHSIARIRQTIDEIDEFGR